ncbi:chromatin-remodeling protein SWR1 KNAG_0C05310 [Huiozyma naganishii CBS 8797]|uniref:Helicase SWR1 n=1 Tax=Huiozyma naganishii (strain ATCC MYA-139 / BCRC 22969 / CBS 8797 / KCTC 17520 / NBRC 10181 / NCYC 3082 / Yp74L-3) TaxID=1071383 RepID=J7S529_HUIN7|nr:hypothetical protein KNAG_0C05310 [Kazachstania naganishii CBS 8797]CCK69629.1 hypothetical protein KNAG_0C05310 [Kazachstania naganishii CBS 8797]
MSGKSDAEQHGEEVVVQKKFEYDLLTNELFHLKEYISLVDFDPGNSHESSDSFGVFLRQTNLALDDAVADGLPEDGAAGSQNGLDSNTTPRRRRQLRASSTAKDSDDTVRDSSAGGVTAKLAKLRPLVQERYEQLAQRLSLSGSGKREAPAANTLKRRLTHSAPKKSSKRVENGKLHTSSSRQTQQREVKQELVTPPQETVPQVGQDEGIILGSAETGDDSESYYFTPSSEEELPSKRRRVKKSKFRVHLYVNPPKQTITNPENVVHPQFPDLNQFLQSFRLLEDDMSPEEFEAFVKEQKHTVSVMKQGLAGGVLRYDPDSNTIQPVTIKDASLPQVIKPDAITYIYKEQDRKPHFEYLLNQGIYQGRLFQNNKRARIARAKRVSQMIEQHFKHIASADERKLKEQERQLKGIGRIITQAVKKRWNVAEKAYRVLKKDEEDQLKRIQGKKHLSKILEQSTQLLGAQLHQNGDARSDIEASVGMTTNNTRSNSVTSMSSVTSSGGESDNLSSSSLDEDEDDTDKTVHKNNSQKGTDDEYGDDKLSVEQLRQKYGAGTQDDVLSDLSDDASSVMTDEDVSSSEEEELEGGSGTDDADSGKLSTEHVGLGALFAQESGDEMNSLDDSQEFILDTVEKDDSTNESSAVPSISKKESYVAEYADPNKQKLSSPESPSEEAEKVEDVTNEIDKKLTEAEQLSVVDVPVPPLLRGTLRTYQKQGLNWLASLYNNDTNGILADEMGLGKTIQTISLLAYLACEKHNWGPHLIVVPTSVLLNWEMEFKRFAPGLKVLTYYGSPQQRKEKRKGWNKLNAFHVCIVSYQLIVQDQHSFKRKRWEYMVLDEAHNIKNFRSTRWQALLNFNTRRRLLLTGTPLQNNLAELWSLLYFLMPQTVVGGKKVSGFADLDAFQQWFGRPVDKIIETGGGYEQDEETKKTVDKLHQVLRPYLLRRLKADVEKQMPGKYEHIVFCRLSKRQRYLYDDFMSRSQTKANLASGNFMTIVNCLMQLRKVCNHPDLFEVRPILTSFDCGPSVLSKYAATLKATNSKFHLIDKTNPDRLDLENLNLVFSRNEEAFATYDWNSISRLKCIEQFQKEVNILRKNEYMHDYDKAKDSPVFLQDAEKFYQQISRQNTQDTIESLEFDKYINDLRSSRRPRYGDNLRKLLSVIEPLDENELLHPLIEPLQTKVLSQKHIINDFAVLTPKAVALDVRPLALGIDDNSYLTENQRNNMKVALHHTPNPLHQLQTKLTIAFPDKSLLQYDCGKLQKLAILLQQLKDNGHRALIFTQMTKVLDVLEQFLNYHGYLYMRLDGATKVEDRQILTERFNSDPRITVFILSSRSGGLGINLTGADTVIFYDSDWNPAMDKQCQDRCHRIGQTRDVHIYRLVSEHTIESNILKKANQKRELDNLVIQKGDFTTDYFSKMSVRDLFGEEVTKAIPIEEKPLLGESSDATTNPRKLESLLAQAEDADDVRAANLAMQEADLDNEDFSEDPNKTLASGETDEYEGTNHVEEYMIKLIANGYYY